MAFVRKRSNRPRCLNILTIIPAGSIMGSSMQQKDGLEYKIEQCLAWVGIIGLGYVGLPLAAAIADVGGQVTGIDIDVDKVAQVNRGRSYLYLGFTLAPTGPVSGQ